MNPRCQSMLPGNEGSELVRVEGLEPPWIAPPDPKSGMSTNFTTPAKSYRLIFTFFYRNPATVKGLLLKKGVQIYRYFITISQFFQNSPEFELRFIKHSFTYIIPKS